MCEIMAMANRNGKRIGGVSGRRDFGQTEDDFYHFLHLLLVGIPVAYDGFLYDRCSIFSNGNICRCRAQKDNAPSFADLYCRFYIFAVKNLFDSHLIGSMFGNNIHNLTVDCLESLGEIQVFAGFYRAILDDVCFCASLFYYAVTGNLCPRVNSKNFHK